MGRITSSISQIGGKFRLLNTILTQIPYHEFYLEPFLGSAIVLLNKPRCRYECGNDLNSELINYLLTIRKYPKEFDKLKQGVFGLVSQEICNRIVRGDLLPRNNIERAYFYYYLNKLTFGGSVQKGYKAMEDPSLSSIDKSKQDYAYITKGNSGIINTRAIPQHTLHNKDFEDIKAQYRGITTMEVPRKKEVENIKANFRGVTPKSVSFGLINTSRCSQSGKGRVDSKEVNKAKKNYKNAATKGISPKTTRPFTNNDCGLLSPLQPNAIKRLRYVNLTTYPFQKVYKMFYEAFHVRKGLGEECFLYIDRPFPGTEKYYKTGFGKEEHDILNNIVLESPFHILESLGGECEWIIDIYRDAGLNIKEVSVKYSTDATSQKKSKEFLISNYNIKKLPKMIIKLKKKKIDYNNSRLGEWL